ncbi:hypothetical protein Esi_0732_0004 [Ectocarpus siliculosus]|uniref:Uncharacterized protein n=1 Tax=Ectocarpus siliculosus TaxID=2880 RepID=D7G6F5_ECTSI|nr:hypothetical protein Esi_0732_0004 [Ectocarpus siliculosus]|eukprot:CBJ33941.1 hypothetical protein Esi_0732_0004 [Ectocarpus siliculosus]
MEFRTSHVANYWMARIFDGASNVSGSVDVGKTWGYPGELISRALKKANMDWPGEDVFDPRQLTCLSWPVDVPGPESDPA